MEKWRNRRIKKSRNGGIEMDNIEIEKWGNGEIEKLRKRKMQKWRY